MSDVAQSIRTIIAELNTEFLERADAIHAVWLCLLSGQHGYLMGPAGTAKSALLDSVSRHIVGARYWHIQMDRMLDKSDSFGQYDLARFDTEHVWERDFTDTFGDCHIALLDEIDKAGPASLTPYLEMLQNRRFKPGKTWVDSPLISAFGAANSALDDEDGALKAIADRFVVKVPVGYLVGRANFLALLGSAVTPLTPATMTTISLTQLQQVIRLAVPAITLPAHVAAAIDTLRATLARGSAKVAPIIVSDRRWKAAVWVLQANAWLAGRDAIAEDDLEVLRFVLWTHEADIPVVEAAVLRATSPYTQALVNSGAQLDDIAAEVLTRQGESRESRSSFASTAMVKLDTIGNRLKRLSVQAEESGRDPARLVGVQAALTATRIAVYRECLGMDLARATRLATPKGSE